MKQDPKTPDTPIKRKLKHDGTVTIATGRSRKETNWKNREMLWSELVSRLSQTTRTQETYDEYRKMTKAQQDERKDTGGFVGGTLKGGRRKTEAVVWRQVITLDADYVQGDFWAAVETMFGYACVIYSTHKHSPQNPRLRLVFPLLRPVTPDEYPAVARRIAADLGIDFFDDTTYQPHRLMYWPSTALDGEYVFKCLDEPWLDPDKVLARYPDWRDPSYWPESSRTIAERKKQADKQGDPLEKPGMVGAFCRTYTISAAIEAFLEDIYASSGEWRYTYLPGTTTGGLVVYDNDLFAYSHHGTDPISGRLVNAFDLVRLHKFGDMDDAAEPGTPVNKLPSYTAMIKFAEEDDLVQETRHQERLAAYEEDFQGKEVSPLKLFFEKKRFVPMYMGEWFLTQYEAVVLQDELYVYENGRYIYGERLFREKATTVLKSEFQTNRITEALNYIKNTVPELTADEAADTGKYLNLKNGLLDLETLEFMPHTQDLRTIVQLPVDYNPDAKCPAIEEFLNQVTPDSINMIEEMLGYCLIPTMKYEKAFLFHGDGGNGKGTLIAVMQAFFGPQNVSNVALQSLTENRFSAAELYGKMVNLHADIPNRLIEDSSLFKELTSGDRLQAERKHKAPFNFCNRAKLVFSANELSSSKDNSEGFHRRWVIIPFPNKFTDRELRQRLFSPGELSGLLLRALVGLRRLRSQDGFSELEGIKKMAIEYREKSDSVYQFLKGCCELDPDEKVGKQELYDTYRGKCLNWGCYPVNQTNFNAKMKTIYPEVTEYRETSRQWKGIKRIIETEEFLTEKA